MNFILQLLLVLGHVKTAEHGMEIVVHVTANQDLPVSI
jgi:hypothetical protein